MLEKSRIRAPVSGVVLQRELREGETVVALSPLPVARIGDLSQRYVRADIELLDIGRVRVGQRATITSDAYPGRRYAGTVVQLGQRMGERHSVSEDPADKRDVKVLDARIRLDGDPPLPVGLRVDVAIDAR
uniref:Secretion protein HlyD n=1 Tax=Mizugakiibacter sediminis TaxID=1475481 RepID=A0A0U1PAD0_9GAMM